MMSDSLSGPVVAIAANDAWNVINYRSGLIRALQAGGYRVLVLAPAGRHEAAIRDLGVDFRAVAMAPRGKSPVGDLRTLAAYALQLRAARPAALLGFTAKPNIYGSLAARALGIPVINNISGLGAVFGGEGVLNRLVSGLYRVALRRSAKVFFQNRDDRALFEARGIVRHGQVGLLPGSGVNLEHFARRPSKGRAPFTFLFAGRLLWDKGVAEYVEAARRIASTDTRFRILGIVEPESAAAVPASLLREWSEEGIADYLGSASDVRDAFAEADCVVLPSYYREGTPRVLLEASAMGIPVITTDAPGCREAVDNGLTGLLCTPRSVDSLVSVMKQMLELPTAKRNRMGAAARAKMEREYREEIVHRAYLDALAELGIRGA
ncbi:MAG: glycosyltransferase family 4 protein [Pseudomonadota bacterium]